MIRCILAENTNSDELKVQALPEAAVDLLLCACFIKDFMHLL